MVLQYITKGGSRIHGPPYTKTEQDDLYRRTAGGPVTLARADDKTTYKKAAKKRTNKTRP